MIGELARLLGIPYATLVVTLGVSLLGASVGLVGCFIVLRRRALTGDALAHAALPGVCVAFMLAGGRSLPWLLVGAFAAGLVGVQVISALRRFTRVKEDAAIGIVLSVFYGLGVVLLAVIQNRFPGASKAGLETYILGQAASMHQEEVELIALASLLTVMVLAMLFKEFRLICFDGDFARAQGWPALLLDFLLMGLVAVAVAVGLPAVGVVMIAALLILPGVTARFWTDRLPRVLALASVCGAATGFLGAALSTQFSGLPTGPIIVLVGSGFFAASAVAAPRRGILGRLLADRRFRTNLALRRLLQALYEQTEQTLPSPAAELGGLMAARSWSGLELERLLRIARRRGWVDLTNADRPALTGAGLRCAVEAVRFQRLAELFLTERPDQAAGLLNLAEDTLHLAIPAELTAELTAKLRRAGRWPSLPADRAEGEA